VGRAKIGERRRELIPTVLNWALSLYEYIFHVKKMAGGPFPGEITDALALAVAKVHQSALAVSK
jgi:hypothetical protein